VSIVRVVTVTCAVLVAAGAAVPAVAQETRNAEQQQILAAIEQLSAATAPEGGGADAYAAILADDFSRWTLGGESHDRTSWVEGVRGWFDDGWRVAERRTEHLEIEVRGTLAFTRRIVTEQFRGPDGELADPGTAALAEVWVRGDHGWQLWRVDARPLARD
jgi:opacity protein-like surface antigen